MNAKALIIRDVLVAVKGSNGHMDYWELLSAVPLAFTVLDQMDDMGWVRIMGDKYDTYVSLLEPGGQALEFEWLEWLTNT